jgi:uncharacterized membrane protein YfhO
MLVAAQTYHHVWHAYVDGRPVRLWRANEAFQAVVVPAGTHQVQLIYKDRRFQLGTVISLTALLACLGGLAFLPAAPKTDAAERCK